LLKTKESNMAKKLTKTQHIRRLLKQNPHLTPKEVAKKVQATINLVYQVMSTVRKEHIDRAITAADTAAFGETPQSQPPSILDNAKEIIYGDREKTYGSPDKNLQAIAEYWSNHIHTRFGERLSITPEDVCIMMTLLKAARLGNDLTHRDSLVDAVGYLALLERIQK